MKNFTQFFKASSIKQVILTCFVMMLMSFATVIGQTLNIEKVSVSGCYYSGGSSKCVVYVQVGWTGLASGDNITVSLGGTTRTIAAESKPAYTKIVSPQVVAFEIPSDGSTGNVSASVLGLSASSTYTAQTSCDPLQCSSGELGGQVFFDYNNDGTHQSTETQGQSGVTVTVTDKNGTTYSTTTDGNGKWKLNIPSANYCVRVEYSNIPSSLRSSSTVAGATTVQFYNAATCSADLGVLDISDYSQANPKAYVPIWANGDPGDATNSSKYAISTFDYNTTGNPIGGGPISNSGVIPYSYAGSLWGIAWDRVNKKVYSSAIVRRHTGLGVSGLAGVYVYDPVANSYTSYDLAATTGEDFGTVPNNASRNLGSIPNPSYDDDVFDKIAKVGIGAISINEAGTQLYAMNLNKKQIVVVNLPSMTLNKVINVPDPGCGTTGNFRPWACSYYKDKLYVGVVCDAQTSQKVSDMKATIYQIDPSTNASTNILEFPLSYPKGIPNGGVGSGWYPWSDDYNDLVNSSNANGGGSNGGYPTPVLADIDFDIDGSMVIAFDDRSAWQFGYYNYLPDPSHSNTSLWAANAGGDILRAFYSNGVYALENAGKAGALTGAHPSNNEGPGFGEFFNDNFVCCHTETMSGGLAIKPGSGEVAGVFMDPNNSTGQIFAGGVKYLFNNNGAFSRGYSIYGGTNDLNTFGKSNGLGDIVFAVDIPNFSQIGNRVWQDTDGDGIQDPCEPGIPNISVKLYDNTGALVTSTTTDADGNYYFGNGANGVNLTPGANYYVVVGTGQFTTGTGLVDGTSLYGSLTLSNTGEGTNPTNNDNNGTIAPNSGVTAAFAGLPYARVIAPAQNTVDHTIDFGFTYGTLGNYVWYDANKNGLQDEPANQGQNNVTVELYKDDGTGNFTLAQTTVTANDASGNPGYYNFIIPVSGNYKVKFPTIVSGNFLTAQNATVATDGNSDAVVATGYSPVVVMNVLGTGVAKNNPTIDAGYVNCYKPNAGLDQSICAGNAVNLTGSPTTGTWSALSGNPAGGTLGATTNGVASVSFTNSASGNYGYVYTVAGGCTDTMFVKVVQPLATIVGTTPLCVGNTSTFTDATTGGTWASSNTAVATVNASTGVVTAVGEGTTVISYTVDSTMVCGCNVATFNLTVNDVPHLLAITGPNKLCVGSMITLLSPSGGGTWSSSSNATATVNSSGNVTGVSVGTVTISYSKTNSCGTDTKTYSVQVCDPIPAVSGVSTLCAGQSSTFTNSLAGGTWSSSNTAVATVNASTGVVIAVAEGNAVITYTVAPGTSCCSNSSSANLTVNATPVLTANIGSSTVCTGSLITLMNPAGGGTWSSSNNAVATVNSSGNVTGVSAGTADITYTKTNSCGSDSKTTSVTVTNPLSNITGSTTICLGSPLTFANATAGGSWTSSNTAVATINSSTGVVTTVAAGTTTITYTVASGSVCGSNTKSVTLTVEEMPSVSAISGASVVCTGSTINLSSSPAAGTWTSSNNAAATVNNAGVVSGVTSGTANITYTVTNSCGTDSKSATITVQNSLPAIVGTTNVCAGSTVTLSNPVSGGTWSSSDNAIATVDATTGVVSGVSAGNATITYTVGVGTVCGSNTKTVQIQVSASPSLAPVLGGGVVCTGSMITLTNATGGGNWSSSNNSVATVNSSGNVTGMSAGSVTITYTANNGCGTDTKSATVFVQNPLTPNVGNGNICVGNTSNLTNGTAGGTWSSSDNAVATVNSSTGVVTAVAPGFATISYTVASGSVCGSNAATTSVYVSTTPTLAAITGTTSVCPGSFVTLMNPSGGGNWSSSNPLVATINSSGNVSALTSGTTTITYTATTTCGSASVSTVFTVFNTPSTPTVTASDDHVCNGSTVTLTSSSATGNQWYKDGSLISGATNQTYTVTTPGTYTVKVTNANGCQSASSANSVITSGVVSGFSINQNPQDIGGNNFKFTSTTPTTNNTYSWKFGDGTTSTAINPSRTYTTTGTFEVTQIVTNTVNGCIDSVKKNAIVVSCCVTSGHTAGLESKSLGNAASQRVYANALAGATEKQNYNAHLNFIGLPISKQVFGASFTLKDLMPDNNVVTSALSQNTIAKEETPNDIINLSNALNVQAVDYTVNDNCKAATFATKTSAVVYAHTKPICDRLKEANLDQVSNFTVGNYNFILYKLSQRNGNTEYATSFVVGKNNSTAVYELQSSWLNEGYTGMDSMYNFQVWGISEQVVKAMASNIVQKIANYGIVSQTVAKANPDVFIVNHQRNGKVFEMNVYNAGAATSAMIEVKETKNEKAVASSPRLIPVSLNANGTTNIKVNMDDKYEADVKVITNNGSVTKDIIYTNDGTWDYFTTNTTTKINASDFTVVNDNKDPEQGEWRLYRNATVKGTSSDYFAMFKYLKGSNYGRNMTSYKTLKFTINTQGISSVRLVLVKESISDNDFNKQFSVTIPVQNGVQDYAISLDDFRSDDPNAKIDLSDIRMVNFNMMVGAPNTQFTAGVSALRFSQEDVKYINSLNDKNIIVTPNPNNGRFTVSFKSPKAGTFNLQLVEAGSGKTAYTQTVTVKVGENQVEVNAGNKFNLANGYYFLNLYNESTKYNVEKVFVDKK